MLCAKTNKFIVIGWKLRRIKYSDTLWLIFSLLPIFRSFWNRFTKDAWRRESNKWPLVRPKQRWAHHHHHRRHGLEDINRTRIRMAKWNTHENTPSHQMQIVSSDHKIRIALTTPHRLFCRRHRYVRTTALEWLTPMVMLKNEKNIKKKKSVPKLKLTTKTKTPIIIN